MDYQQASLTAGAEILIDEAVKLGILVDCVSEKGFPMLIFPDGQKICLFPKDLHSYLSGLLKGADMQRCFGAKE